VSGGPINTLDREKLCGSPPDFHRCVLARRGTDDPHLCAHGGSREKGHKWLGRYREAGAAGLRTLSQRVIVMARVLRTPANQITLNQAKNDKGTTMARLPSITSKDQLEPKDRAIADGIIASRGSLHGPFSVFLHSPELAGRLAHLGAYVRFEGTLDMRVRVLAAMTVAREFEAEYVWGAQTGSARRQNVPESTISAIRDDRSDGVPVEDLAVIEFTRALLRRHRVSDAAAAEMRKRFGDDGFIQLTGAIGYYSMLSMTVNACKLEAAPGAEALKV
jgi:4-carboxymuconolactone decarboxylase